MTSPAAAPSPSAARSDGRRRAALSLDAILTEAIALLDADGEAALTFRALAARLGGGVASIYWYVETKDDLLAKAADRTLESVLEATAGFTSAPDPVDDLREIATAFYRALDARPWLAQFFMRDTGGQPNATRFYEHLGQQVLRLGLTPRQSLDAVSAILGFTIGTAADLGRRGGAERGERDAERVATAAAVWRELPSDEYPFVAYIVEEFARHDDAEQVRAGLNLLLAGLRLQASG
ncbi:TetR/AcrR family transcriptional regulator [Xylanimonas ulmi]|uniref:TetR family transcriptional regulator n=1 Tax=Xylanimonas ulmi TaxID=228973 RepID=A0A4Q7LY71_9MICO|nr:TetR/AcrR family transcriptional regulator C-terminal domain-containing protein [Xylanibacterium ulmi]RZS60116.1 TetR family transcriptional regulator [Xylanibacterium ulmi]